MSEIKLDTKEKIDAYYAGYETAVRDFATHRSGAMLVGALERPLGDVLRTMEADKRQHLSSSVDGMLTFCDENSHELNEWEGEFVESVSEQFASRGSLSEKQTEILNRIYWDLRAK